MPKAEHISTERSAGLITLGAMASAKINTVFSLSTLASNLTLDEGESAKILSNTHFCRLYGNDAFSILVVLISYEGAIFTDGSESTSSDLRTLLDAAINGDFSFSPISWVVPKAHRFYDGSETVDVYQADVTFMLTKTLQNYLEKYWSNPSEKDGVNFDLCLCTYAQAEANVAYEIMSQTRYDTTTKDLTGLTKGKAIAIPSRGTVAPIPSQGGFDPQKRPVPRPGKNLNLIRGWVPGPLQQYAGAWTVLGWDVGSE